MLEANKSPKKQKRARRKNPEECSNQHELVQTSLRQPLQNRPDLHLTYSKISESGRSYTDGTKIYYLKTPNRQTIVQLKINDIFFIRNDFIYQAIHSPSLIADIYFTYIFEIIHLKRHVLYEVIS